jgi:hypothetical protein
MRGKHYCGVKLCHARKTEAWNKHVIKTASKKLGIPIYQDNDLKYLVLQSHDSSHKGLFGKRHKDLRLLPKECLPERGYYSQYGFDGVDAVGAHGNTPLMEAAWRGDVAIVTALLEAGARRDVCNHDGNNALWLGCVSNKPELVTMLAQAGVDIDHVNATGATSLMYAASSSKPDIVRVLLALGADPSIQTQDDFTAMDMAGSLACLQLLRAVTKAATKTIA